MLDQTEEDIKKADVCIMIGSDELFKGDKWRNILTLAEKHNKPKIILVRKGTVIPIDPLLIGVEWYEIDGKDSILKAVEGMKAKHGKIGSMKVTELEG